ncbi:unnamed protein product [Anisakis simplex]|uniref:PH domain-containing protein n=1 Tax=Anisakis simplex TaxID=6269 RepID=A0A0M3JTB0_ANISI|nr:unnamed protein product [Anisakis simplex]
MSRSRTNPNLLESSQPHHTSSTQSADNLPFLLSATTTGDAAAVQPNAAVPTAADGSFHGYDRIQRLENEIDRLNREIDDLKRKKKEDEEDLIDEWKQKLVKKQQEHNEAISELEANHRKVVDRLNDEYTSTSERVMQNLQRQLEAMGVVQSESRKQELVVTEVENLTEQIKQIATQVTTLNEKSFTDRQTTVQIKEEHVKLREERLAKEQEKLQEERKMVDELNIKLQSTFQRSEEEILKEKWQIRDERNRLNAEKNAFKEEQKFILNVIEKHKAETEAARTAFLNEQHDLLVRMFSEKAAFDEERNAFITQRDNDIARLKAEAQRLQERVKQVEDAEKLMVASRQTYQSKYRELIELEQTLFDECVELQQCRAELEASLTNKSLAYNQLAINEVPFERNLPEVVADPFTDATSNQSTDSVRSANDVSADKITEKISTIYELSSSRSVDSPEVRNEDVRTVLKMHADMLDRYLPDIEIDRNQSQ